MEHKHKTTRQFLDTFPGLQRRVLSPTMLELGVCVRADFTIQFNFFVLWGSPFHDCRSLKIGSLRTSKR